MKARNHFLREVSVIMATSSAHKCAKMAQEERNSCNKKISAPNHAISGIYMSGCEFYIYRKRYRDLKTASSTRRMNMIYLHGYEDKSCQT
jgi:hypothetical protein